MLIYLKFESKWNYEGGFVEVGWSVGIWFLNVYGCVSCRGVEKLYYIIRNVFRLIV